MDAYIGFDSAWMNNPKAPGAICAVAIENGYPAQFHAPMLVTFEQALAFIQDIRSKSGVTLIALDQPTVVPNLTKMRPVERAAASLVSWLGGGVQPSNRGKTGMFCDASPIWRFLTALDATQNPEQARIATNGIFLIEVFPALALASLNDLFFGRLKAPKYNPSRKKTFRHADWMSVANTAHREALSFGCKDLAKWCRIAEMVPAPRKADQDKLDAVLCALIALHWRLRPRESSLLLGDRDTGYMVLPASQKVRRRLTSSAKDHFVAADGVVPTEGHSMV